ncbi:MAG: hypothetical protein FJ144_07375 [Deltaproteobacteria bacterium]|nr:hypothetical protein [Deltaproteobacteria bacterium]
MKPDPQRMIEVTAAHLMMRTAPALEKGYEQSSVGLLAVLLLAVREEYDRSAARRVEENRALRAIFADGARVVREGAPELAKRLEAAAHGEDPSLVISELERTNAELRGLVIDLHARIEEIDAPEARRIEVAIWAELVASTERRRLSLGTF